jgi:hypothetical protein
VVFLDEEDVAEPELLEALVRAQSISGADVVTCGLRIVGTDGTPTLHFFSGEPQGLGVLANGYGNVALLRRAVIDDPSPVAPAEHDADWPFLAGLVVSGTHIVSIPLPLVTRSAGPGAIERDPADALVVAQHAEHALPNPVRSTARLAAGLAADAPRRAPSSASFAQRALRRLLGGAR